MWRNLKKSSTYWSRLFTSILAAVNVRIRLMLKYNLVLNEEEKKLPTAYPESGLK